MNGKNIAYIYSNSLIKECNKIPPIIKRASMVQDLITSYQLFQNKNLAIVKSLDATEDELKLFHSSSYIDFMKKVNEEEDFDDFDEEQTEFGLGYDCPILHENYSFMKTIAGGSLTAAKLLAGRKCEIAINWCGGWHHAQRDSAAGFCYVNDIVLAIQTLTKSFRKILYIDLDVHHGDGVQNAFELSKNILTLSLHKLSPGFYPGTGQLDDLGMSNGKYYSINVPFLDGCKAETFLGTFQRVFSLIFCAFKPEAIVVQCGADSLTGDKLGESNLDLRTIGECIRKILECKLPTLFLGGGGYNLANTARLWTYLTGIICSEELDNDIPDSSEFFTSYGPTYELHIDSKQYEKDLNTHDYIERVIGTITEYCKFIE